VPIVMVMDIPGGTSAHYDKVMELIGEVPADGGIFHVASPSENGWRVVDVWESQEAFGRFFEAKLGAALAQAQVPEGAPPQFLPTHRVAIGQGDTSHAVAFVATIPGTIDQYDEAVEKGGLLDSAGEMARPPGNVVHVCAAKGANEFLIVDVWESPEAFGAFMMNMGPVLESVGIGDFEPPPLQPVHNVIIA